jgi:glycosyltransferase involved in cell wall biosynthesis
LRPDISSKLVIHAPNVHQGGGKALLLALIEAVPSNLSLLMQLDSRMALSRDLSKNIPIKRVKVSVMGRLLAEWRLRKNVSEIDTVLCFGNLPPLFRLAGRTIVFVQNRYILDQVSLDGFSFKIKWRLKIERLWFRLSASNASEFIVQTPSMRSLLEALNIPTGKAIHVLPFVSSCAGYQRSLKQMGAAGLNRPWIYVASGEPHKNHKKLIEAWCLLARDGFFPTLWLTLDAKNHSDLCAWIEQKSRIFNLKLENLGVQSHAQLQYFYTQAQALIYPSTFESFGLPLIEARQAGLAIVASELDFVRDVVDPDEVFDPGTPISIARAVKRFMGWTESSLPLLSATEFLKEIMDESI